MPNGSGRREIVGPCWHPDGAPRDGGDDAVRKVAGGHGRGSPWTERRDQDHRDETLGTRGDHSRRLSHGQCRPRCAWGRGSSGVPRPRTRLRHLARDVGRSSSTTGSELVHSTDWNRRAVLEPGTVRPRPRRRFVPRVGRLAAMIRRAASCERLAGSRPSRASTTWSRLDDPARSRQDRVVVGLETVGRGAPDPDLDLGMPAREVPRSPLDLAAVRRTTLPSPNRRRPCAASRARSRRRAGTRATRSRTGSGTVLRPCPAWPRQEAS